MRSELAIKEQKVQQVIEHLNRAEEFIASNEATFLKGEQDKVEMANKVALLEKHVVELSTVNENLLKQISENTFLKGEQDKVEMSNKIALLERHVVELSTVNETLLKEISEKHQPAVM